MKRKFVLVLVVSMMLSLLYTSCSEDPATTETESATGTVLTDTDIADVALATINAGYFPSMINGFADGMYDKNNDNNILSGNLTVTNDGTTFTFNACAIDYPSYDITFGGEYSVVRVDPSTITLTDFNMNFANPETGTVINTIASGVHIFTNDGTWSGNITLSGITNKPCIVLIEMTMNGGVPEVVTNATIDGVDYTLVFQTTLENL